VPQEVPVSPRNHRAGILQQPHDSMARGGGLPLVAANRANSKHGASDVLLGGTITRPIERLQHPARPHSLLPCQSGVGRNGPSVKRCQKAMRGLEPTESIEVQRNDGHRWTGR